jgi:GNAT superfamily N-acetyltransferase
MSEVRLQALRGRELLPYLDALGELRIAVFREYPYLYDGSMQYERDYLRSYAECSRSLVVMAWDGEVAIGATTCMPLEDEGAEFKKPFLHAAEYDLSRICYFGESILLPPYRGQGIGKAFMQHRLAHAQSLGAGWAAFCAVDRPTDHPQRPPAYRPLDAFWQSQGFVKHPELQTTFTWKEIHEPAESPKTLTFWLKPLSS